MLVTFPPHLMYYVFVRFSLSRIMITSEKRGICFLENARIGHLTSP